MPISFDRFAIDILKKKSEEMHLILIVPVK